jgi:hypothetical protein
MKRIIFVIFGIQMNPVELMQRKSGNAFNIFKKTLNKLQKINTLIDTHKQASLDAIAMHQKNHDDLNAQQAQNLKLVDKLNDFVNPA